MSQVIGASEHGQQVAVEGQIFGGVDPQRRSAAGVLHQVPGGGALRLLAVNLRGNRAGRRGCWRGFARRSKFERDEPRRRPGEAPPQSRRIGHERWPSTNSA